MTIIAQRLFIGLLQGLALALLTFTSEAPAQWPATNHFIFLPLCTTALFIPLLIVQSLGNMLAKTIVIWVALATAILSGTTFYAVFRQEPTSLTYSYYPALLMLLCLFLFIAHALILSGDQDRRIMARYPTYFDVAWKLGVQTIFTAAFTATFWMLLWLGVSLFEVTHLTFFKYIITNKWFAIPATTLAIAAALHITDVKAPLIRGIRTLGLALLSWLLPLTTAIISLFLLSLFFTGVTPLWQTRHASVLLLAAAFNLIILINAAYQDGLNKTPAIQYYSSMLARIILIPIILLAIYALSLRVQQYGWSISRINAAACMLITATYAAGYTTSVFITNSRCKILESCNVIVACFILLVLLALLSPLADPARLTVASQLARLHAGITIPEKFDFKALRYEGLRFGQQALNDLQNSWQGPQADYVHAHAKKTLALQLNEFKENLLDAKAKAQFITIHTPDGKLPGSFLNQSWNWSENSITIPSCLRTGSSSCDAWMIQDRESSPLILILSQSGFTGFKQDAKKIWIAIGEWRIPFECNKVMQAATQGKFNMVAPQSSQHDIEIMGWRTRFEPSFDRTLCK